MKKVERLHVVTNYTLYGERFGGNTYHSGDGHTLKKLVARIRELNGNRPFEIHK